MADYNMLAQDPYLQPGAGVGGIGPQTESLNFFNAADKYLRDRNFQNLLAGIGAGISPQGAGGAIGNALIAYNRGLAAQQTAAAGEKQRDAANEKNRTLLGTLLGGEPDLSKITPKGQPGITSFERSKDGSFVIKGDIPAIERQQLGPSSQTSLPTLTAPTVPAESTNQQPQEIPPAQPPPGQNPPSTEQQLKTMGIGSVATAVAPMVAPAVIEAYAANALTGGKLSDILPFF
jgi:hypothetical protein